MPIKLITKAVFYFMAQIGRQYADIYKSLIWINIKLIVHQNFPLIAMGNLVMVNDTRVNTCMPSFLHVGYVLLRKCSFMTEEQLKVATLLCWNTLLFLSALKKEVNIFMCYKYFTVYWRGFLLLKYAARHLMWRCWDLLLCLCCGRRSNAGKGNFTHKTTA